MSRPAKVSPLQAIYQSFPNAVRFVNGQITRVRNIVSSRGEWENQLAEIVKRTLVRRIFAELQRQHGHDVTRHNRRATRRAEANPAGGAAPRVGPPAQATGEAAAFDPFDVMGDAGEATPQQHERVEQPMGVLEADMRPPPAPAMPLEREIALIEIDDDTTIRTKVFPRSVHCQRCGHFELLDPERVPATLGCTCCCQGTFRIEPIVFICGRCADMRELVPPGASRNGFRRPGEADRLLAAAIACPDCHRGHVHLEKHGTNDVARWEWRCQQCAGYRVTLSERCLRCALPKTSAIAANVTFMNALPASAPNALQALVLQEMFVGGSRVTIAALRIAAAEARDAGWSDAFAMDMDAAGVALEPEGIAELKRACVKRAYLVRDVWAVLACYGYKAGKSASHPQSPIEPEERLAAFFPDPEHFVRFRAFTHSTRGAALVIELNPDTIVERLATRVPPYADHELGELIAGEAPEIARRPTRELLRASDATAAAYRALHAIEHAFLMAAMRQLGTDALGSRLFPSEGAIVLFEKSEVGRGGVVQLTNRGKGLVQLVRAASDLLSGCAQGCSDGCPSCVFVRDQFCSHPLEELGASWLPANLLLSRAGAAAVLGVTET